MRFSGTVKSFNPVVGRGLIEADSGGEYLVFERTGIYFNAQVRPLMGQRLTYEIGTVRGERQAVSLGNV